VLAHVIHTFFGGSAASAMDALLGSADVKVTPAELARLTRMVRRARARDEQP
jgi:hypothetical protein